ncbi:MAG: hypothetical protein QOG64_2696, partial [Acidimicrobiaceae bacterium]|nr:hypothetical protein [Acidimicrobiaceae bacterium]
VVEEAGDRLSPAELVSFVVLLYVAGHETTVNLIGNGVLALLRHPDQMRRLQDDPSMLGNAVDELLRFDSPVQFSRRITLQEVTIGERTIPAGTFVLTCLGSANRDPARWGEGADQLDLGRQGAGQHVSFGNGAHYCLGANLARMEAQAAIGTLLCRFPGISLAEEEPPWNGRIVLRGLDRLPVVLGAPA